MIYNSKFCSHVIKQNSCNVSYIGKNNILRCNTYLHRRHNKEGFLKVTNHLKTFSEGYFRVMPTYKMKSDNTEDSRYMEKKIMNRF